jgi:hypothetical protein
MYNSGVLLMLLIVQEMYNSGVLLMLLIVQEVYNYYY